MTCNLSNWIRYEYINALHAFLIWQVVYKNTTVTIDFCDQSNPPTIENDYFQGTVNLYTDAKAPCDPDGN